MRVAEVRRAAAHDFITDPDGRSVRAWYEREDRPYQRLVRFATFETWAVDDEWNRRRDQFWAEVEHKVLQAAQHKVLVQRLREVNELTIATDAMAEYLRPIIGADGSIRRHPPLLDNEQPNPLAGLPVFPLELPPLDKFGKFWIDLHKLLMTKRGEVTSRSEDVRRPEGSALDPATSAVPFSQEDIRNLARYALRMRQPELQGEVLEVLAEQDAERAVEDQEALEDEDSDAAG
jgi:hypothetical protein